FGTLPPETSAIAVQNLEALTRGGAPQALLYGYHRGLTRPMPEVASAQAEQSVRPEVRVMPMLPSDASMDNLTFDNEVLLNGIYGDHLKAADSYGGDLPDEYFDDRDITSPEVRRNIRAGVRELQR